MAYVDKILHRFSIHDSKKGMLSFRQGVPLSKCKFPKTDKERCAVSKVPYATTVGSLMYVMLCMRPDIHYTIGIFIH